MHDDLIGKKLGEAIEILRRQDIKYRIVLTKPPKETAVAGYDCRILRAKPEGGILELVVCSLSEGRQQEGR